MRSDRRHTALSYVDFKKYAEAYGAHGHLVEKTDDFQPLLQKCLDEGGVHLIEVPTNYVESGSSAYLNFELPKEIAALRAELGTCSLLSDDVPELNTGMSGRK